MPFWCCFIFLSSRMYLIKPFKKWKINILSSHFLFFCTTELEQLLPKFMHLPHEPLDSLSIHTICPVTSFLEMGANDHGTCLKVVLHISMGYTRTDENRDPDRLGNLCYTNSAQVSKTWVWEHLSATCMHKNTKTCCSFIVMRILADCGSSSIWQFPQSNKLELREAIGTSPK